MSWCLRFAVACALATGVTVAVLQGLWPGATTAAAAGSSLRWSAQEVNEEDPYSGERRLESFRVGDQDDRPVIEWPREWMPVRVTITAPSRNASAAPAGDVRVVYSYRHPEFRPTCAVLQHEEVAVAQQAVLPLFYESQTIRAVYCIRGQEGSNETVARVEVRRYPGLLWPAAALLILSLLGIFVIGVMTALCMQDGASYSLLNLFFAVFPAHALAMNICLALDFFTLSAAAPAMIVVVCLGVYGALNVYSVWYFWNYDLVAQRKADYQFRRWTDRYQFEHFVLGSCAACCGNGCLKLLYSRTMRTWPLSPDFKPPPGCVVIRELVRKPKQYQYQ